MTAALTLAPYAAGLLLALIPYGAWRRHRRPRGLRRIHEGAQL